MCYWRRVARRNGTDPPSGIPLHALEQRYRHPVAARCGAIALAELLSDERQALHQWRQTLRDEG
jgi:hypothetical protein